MSTSVSLGSVVLWRMEISGGVSSIGHLTEKREAKHDQVEIHPYFCLMTLRLMGQSLWNKAFSQLGPF